MAERKKREREREVRKGPMHVVAKSIRNGRDLVGASLEVKVRELRTKSYLIGGGWKRAQ